LDTLVEILGTWCTDNCTHFRYLVRTDVLTLDMVPHGTTDVLT